ncbi:hypothetical protein UA08_03476 [Talaromyces atroroseus]|uniref:Uncharacterized protein n=1 Tax=Talaromyces atroroseus TaxID=1441469 RepID=A0A225ART8_TALAT|nr:hypothetical protein UA08_03476 [Talaromyces atroroseus]OKL61074.1 hypothetical protein UA08_03476 [Talaromyces atroroseus]
MKRILAKVASAPWHHVGSAKHHSRFFSTSKRHRQLMDLTGFTEEQLMVRKAVSQICSHFPSSYWQECDQQEKDPKEFHAALAKDGWLGIALPEELGGSGLDRYFRPKLSPQGISEATVMMQTITQSGAGMAGAQSIHANIYATQPLAKFGTKEQVEKVIPNIINGTWRTCFGVTEPNTGLDTLRLKTMATRTDNAYLVSGQKIWITCAQAASLMILLARTTPLEEVQKPNDGLSMFAINLDRENPGLELKKIKKMGARAVDANEVFFDNYEIFADTLVGKEGDGFRIILHGMNAERCLLAGEALGLGYAALDKASRYANERSVFGRPIGTNQGIAHPLADVYMRLEAAKLATYHAARMFDASKTDSSISFKTVGIACNSAKYLAAEAAYSACERAVMTHGGMGYAVEFDVERWFRECFIPRIAPPPSPPGCSVNPAHSSLLTEKITNEMVDAEEQVRSPADSAGGDDAGHSGAAKGSAVKDKECQYCHQAFTSSSLGRHLDQYLFKKKPDGIHDVDEIRRIRSSITRRQARTSNKHESPDVGVRKGHNDSPDGGAHDPAARLRDTPRFLFNTPSWHATGVINDLPESTTQDVVNSSRTPMPQPQTVATSSLDYTRNSKAKDADTVRALELALQEVLDNIRAATTISRARLSPFDFDVQSESYPALVLKLLPPPPALFATHPFATPTSFPMEPPGVSQVEVVRHALRAHIEQWRNGQLAAADTGNSGGRSKNNQVNDPSVINRTAQQHDEISSRHLDLAYQNWMVLPADVKKDAWQLELTRAFVRESEKRKDLEGQLTRVQQEANQLRAQVERLGSCQWPREFALFPPDMLPLSRDAARELDALDSSTANAGSSRWDYDNIVAKWKRVVMHDKSMGRVGVGSYRGGTDEPATESTATRSNMNTSSSEINNEFSAFGYVSQTSAAATTSAGGGAAAMPTQQQTSPYDLSHQQTTYSTHPAKRQRLMNGSGKDMVSSQAETEHYGSGGPQQLANGNTTAWSPNSVQSLLTSSNPPSSSVPAHTNAYDVGVTDDDGTVLYEEAYGGLLKTIVRHNDLAKLTQYLRKRVNAIKGHVKVYYWDPFYVAAESGSTEALDLLFKHYNDHLTDTGSIPMIPLEKRQLHLLHVACLHARIETALYLLDTQPGLASLHARNGDRQTPLISTASSLTHMPHYHEEDDDLELRSHKARAEELPLEM